MSSNMVDYTRINVSLNGRYLFATEQGELGREDDAKRVFDLLKDKFPESEGYLVTATKWVGRGHTPEWAI